MNFRDELAKVSPKLRNGADIYVWGAGYGFKHIREQYKIIHNIELELFIHAFIDNDPSKHGTEYFGKKVISPDDLEVSKSVVLVSVMNYYDKSIENQLIEMGFHWRSDCFDRVYIEWLLRRHMRTQLSKFINVHHGERCFIIGNGPSLKIDDLEYLKNEITFASNQVYYMFDTTSWRPTYYVVEDGLYMANNDLYYKATNGIKFFWAPGVFQNNNYKSENTYYFDLDFSVSFQQYPYSVDFSKNPGIFYWSSTVTYTCLQLAVLMGFKNIFLLGVDCNYPYMRKANGEVFNNKTCAHFYPDNDNTSDVGICIDFDLHNAGYKAALKYADESGIKIYNATRGGKLEVFERVNFDNLFK